MSRRCRVCGKSGAVLFAARGALHVACWRFVFGDRTARLAWATETFLNVLVTDGILGRHVQ